MAWRARAATAAVGAAAITVTGLAPAFAADRVGVGEVDPELTQVTVFNINDFHGRIDTNFSGELGKTFACTVVTAQAAAGDSVFLSAGDNIGATPFTSMSQADEPTIAFLSALGLEATAVGNHEFDTGWDDLNDRVIPLADYVHLGANVYLAGTTTPALDTHYITEVNGVRVGVIGAVTAETPSLVDPGGIGAITFGDPVDAVNRVAAEIAGETDVIIAQYHEGTNVTSSVTDAAAGSPIFDKIVNGTTAEVDAIFTGHTHQTYAWDAPIPGGEGTRPIVQSNSYAALLASLTLGVDTETMTVEQFSLENVANSETVTADCEADPAYQQAAAIVDEAVAVAEEIGSEVVGSVTADITTAHRDGNRDDRGRESALSNLIAEAWLWAMNQPGRPTADIGLMNPGGVRSELLYEASGDEADGEVTFAEAAAVNPFANTMMVADITGAQFKTLLEQQWQPEGSSRPFLKLGLTDNVRYTFDPDAAAGERITGIWYNGEPMDPAATFTVTAGSFLINGGDGFTVLAEATNARDTGLTDLEAWTTFLVESSPLSPSFEKNGVAVHSALPIEATAGEDVTFTVSGMNLTSLGAPANTTFTIMLGDVEVGTAAITEEAFGYGDDDDDDDIPTRNGLSEVTFTVPADFAGGETVITLIAEPTGTVVRVPAVITAVEQPAPPVTPGPIVETDIPAENVAGSVGLLAGLTLLLAAAAVLVARRRQALEH